MIDATQSNSEATSDDTDDAWRDAVQAACRRIAPTWPLDRFIAVNPLWGFIDQPVQAASENIAHLCGSPLTMPMAWYLNHYDNGSITEAALALALKRHGLSMGPASFRTSCSTEPAQAGRMQLLTDAIDKQRNLMHQPACQDVVVHAIGQHCASWFDQGEARWSPTPATSLYAAWREIASHDNGPSLLTGINGIADRIAALPAKHDQLIHLVCEKLEINKEEYERYFTALLLSVNGWAAWCAYLSWQAKQQGKVDNHLEQLLAIRLAWEWVLADGILNDTLISEWHTARRTRSPEKVFASAWVWQDALEITWQNEVNRGLRRPITPYKSTPEKSKRPALQAVFCIDVRSERIRRALETSDPTIQTHGFAGFFGLPIDYLPLGGHQARPQLPGLLPPKLRAVTQAATSTLTQNLVAKRRFRLSISQAWEGFRTTASSGFGFVETIGLSYAWKLLKSSLNKAKAAGTDNDGLSSSEYAQLNPVLDDVALEDAIDLCAGILRAMSMQEGFAPLVLLIGHGSQTTNNPHAASLDCGACCGQTGEINARILANLLNQTDIRAGLHTRGITVPEDTWFVAGLHNTTTDEIQLFDIARIQATHSATLTQTREWLAQASQRSRAERAPTMGLTAIAPELLAEALRQRAEDWSQVRPEWGLADNAAFIAGPRNRTKHMNLQGRSFLHDYNHTDDSGYSVLELILTAPVIVAHWINMQYYASTVDNRRWGSGNKVLHNVVGGNIGVFEGNGGDLRIGLPMQSLHDGDNWVHTPLRLSVWIEAPREAISSIVQRHEKLGQLVNGGWLHLFCIEPSNGNIFRYATHSSNQGQWLQEAMSL